MFCSHLKHIRNSNNCVCTGRTKWHRVSLSYRRNKSMRFYQSMCGNQLIDWLYIFGWIKAHSTEMKRIHTHTHTKQLKTDIYMQLHGRRPVTWLNPNNTNSKIMKTRENANFRGTVIVQLAVLFSQKFPIAQSISTWKTMNDDASTKPNFWPFLAILAHHFWPIKCTHTRAQTLWS